MRYVSTVGAAEVSVPATVQAAIAARIDRLDPAAKRTLSAAAVIGSKFSRDLLQPLGIDPVLDDLVGGELIDQITFTGEPEYVFHHPLIRTVAYESQLKSDRAEMHRRLAAAIESRDPASADENAALIAEHLEAAGDLHARLRLAHARRSVVDHPRHRGGAGQLGAGAPGRRRAARRRRGSHCDAHCRRAPCCAATPSESMSTSPATRFDELRELCAAAGDKASLAIGMAGLVLEHMMHGRMREASRLASETMALVESIGDPTLTVALSLAAIATKIQTGEVADALRWSQTVIDLADGDPRQGEHRFRFAAGDGAGHARHRPVGAGPCGVARRLRPGAGHGPQRRPDVACLSSSHSPTVSRYRPGCCWPTTPRCATSRRRLRSPSDRVRISRSALPGWALGIALVYRESSAERERGLAVLGQVRDMCLHGRLYVFMLPTVDVLTARERARCGDRDEAIPQMRAAIDDLFRSGQLGICVPATGVLVETLLERGADGDVTEAEAAIDRLATAPGRRGAGDTRHLAAAAARAARPRARRREPPIANIRDRYRAMATSLGFEGHMAWAEAMP